MDVAWFMQELELSTVVLLSVQLLLVVYLVTRLSGQTLKLAKVLQYAQTLQLHIQLQ